MLQCGSDAPTHKKSISNVKKHVQFTLACRLRGPKSFASMIVPFRVSLDLQASLGIRLRHATVHFEEQQYFP